MLKYRRLAKASLELVLPRRLLLLRGSRRSNAVCLTFDDGPHPTNTPRILDVLRTHGVRATFFLIGRHVELHPELVRRIAMEGHVIGHHSFSHSQPQFQTAVQLLDEVRKTDELLMRLVGRKAKLFRPPWGKLTVAKLLRLWSARHTVVLWTADPKEGEKTTAAQLLEWFADHPLQAGDILLMHDDQPHVAEVLPAAIEQVRKHRLSFATPVDWTAH